MQVKGTARERTRRCLEEMVLGVARVRMEREARPRRQLHPIDLEKCRGHWGATEGSGAGSGQMGDGFQQGQGWGIREEVWGEGVLIHLPLCIHLTGCNFLLRREYASRHPQCRTAAHPQGDPAHLQHTASMSLSQGAPAAMSSGGRAWPSGWAS